MENSTEASTWAFNNQEKKGQTGTLTPKPINNKTGIKLEAGADFVKDEKVKTPNNDIQEKAVNKARLPTKVQKNISTLASTTRSDFEVKRSKYKEVKSKSSKQIKNTNKESVTIKTNETKPKTVNAVIAPFKIVVGFVVTIEINIVPVKTPLKSNACCKDENLLGTNELMTSSTVDLELTSIVVFSRF